MNTFHQENLEGLQMAMEKAAYASALKTVAKETGNVWRGAARGFGQVSRSAPQLAVRRAVGSMAANELYGRTANQVNRMAEMAKNRGMTQAQFMNRVQKPLASRLENTANALDRQSMIGTTGESYIKLPGNYGNKFRQARNVYSYIPGGNGGAMNEARTMINDSTHGIYA